MLKIFFLSALFLFSVGSAIAQDKATLQSQREKLKREIEQTQEQYKEAQKNTKVNLSQLALINKKVNLQENVVGNIHKEIRTLSDDIYLTQLEINRMNRVLDTLKGEYAQSMIYAYKNRGNYNFLNFIFSSKDFNEAVKRVAFLKSYRNYREIQADNILKTQDLLNQKVQEMNQNKERKNVVLKEESVEMDKLEKQKTEKATVVKELQGKQKELSKIIAAKRKEDLKLQNAISAMVKREIELARAESARKEKERLEAIKKANAAAAAANKNATASTPSSAPATKNETRNATTEAPTRVTNPTPATNSVLVNTEAEATLNANFEKNKGRLPWPVNGFILYKFGTNELPGGIKFNNFGVTIATKVGEPVKAVFEGEVTLVSFMENSQAVFIKHGRYFTVYSNLSGVTVKRGDHVQTGQVIGRAAENDEGEGGKVEFLLLRESDYQNPQSWLK